MKRKRNEHRGARYQTLKSPLLGKGGTHGRTGKANRRRDRIRLDRGDWNDQSARCACCGDSGLRIGTAV